MTKTMIMMMIPHIYQGGLGKGIMIWQKYKLH